MSEENKAKIEAFKQLIKSVHYAELGTFLNGIFLSEII